MQSISDFGDAFVQFRMGVSFRAEKYANYSMKPLSKENRDFHNIKQQLDAIGYNPVYSISDIKNQNLPVSLKESFTNIK